ncbi:MAG: BON domain-containing protein [Planctomycetaceae bacterium]
MNQPSNSGSLTGRFAFFAGLRMSAVTKVLAPAVVILAGGMFVQAQAQNTSTTSTAFGSRTYGGTQQSSRTTGSNTSAMGQSGSMGGQGSALGQASSFGASSNRQQGGFVGASSQNARSVGNVMSGQNSGQMGGMGGQMGQFGQGRNNRNGQNGFGQQNNNGNKQQPQGVLRVPLKLGFTPTPVVSSTFTATTSARLQKLPALKNQRGVNVAMEGSTVVLRGEVASEADRELAEGLMMLEPEVSAVRNELVVRSAPPAPEALPAPSNGRSSQP